MNAGIYIVWIVIAVCSSALLSDAKYQCYQWTAEDRKEMGTKPSVASEKAQCEKRRNTFTGGDNGNYTGCGECRCCMKVLPVTPVTRGTTKALVMLCSILKKVDEKDMTKSHCSP